MRSMRTPLVLARRLLPLGAGLALALPLGAQAPALKRPELPAGADTNDATFYLVHAHRMLDREPAKAVPLFRYAAQLDPASADALYGERVAILLSDPTRLVFYMNDDRKTLRQPDIQRADSLDALAIRRAPLFYRRYDRAILQAYARQSVIRSIQMSEGANAVDRTAIEFELGKWLASGSPLWMRAWLAYSDGDFVRSAQLWRDAMKGVKPDRRGGMYAERARSLAHAGMLDSAIAAQKEALAIAEKRDKEKLESIRDSRAEREYVLGALLAGRGDTAGARDAYQRALTEDLGYHPAHRALAEVALAGGDHATAVSEYRQALEVAGDDATLHFAYGVALLRANDAIGAVAELQKAAELAPLWAEPWQLLARLYDKSEMFDEARTHYAGYLARATQTNPMRAVAEERLKALSATAAK